MRELKLVKLLLSLVASEAGEVLAPHLLLVGEKGPGIGVTVQAAQLSMVGLRVLQGGDKQVFGPPILRDHFDELCRVGMTPKAIFSIGFFPLTSQRRTLSDFLFGRRGIGQHKHEHKQKN